MKLLLKAHKIAVAFELSCPQCKETIPAPSGSLYWTSGEMEGIQDKGKAKLCDTCRELVAIPKP